MIKNRNLVENARKQVDGMPRPAPTTHNPAQTPGDVIVENYRLEVLKAQPTLAQLQFALSTLLGEASRAGYRMVDRVPFSQSESILIFEKLNK